MSLFKFKTKPGLTLWPDLACARDIIYIMILYNKYTKPRAQKFKSCQPSIQVAVLSIVQ